MADNDVPNAHVFDSVRQSVEIIDVDGKQQHLDIDIRNLVLDSFNARYTVDFLRRHPNAIDKLTIWAERFSREAVDILREFLVSTTLQEICIIGHLGNLNGERLVSALHRNTAVSKLDLRFVGLEGAAGGEILSELMLNNPHLKKLCCFRLALGPEGVRAMDRALRSNQTVTFLVLFACGLGDQGLSAIVNSLDGNSTMKYLNLGGNGVTSNGLCHVTRMLRRASVERLGLESNPGICDHEETTRLFVEAVSQDSKLVFLYLNLCQLPGHAVTAILRAAATHKKLRALHIFDRVRLQGQALEQKIEIIPTMLYLVQLQVNVDVTEESVLRMVQRNTSLLRLYIMENPTVEVTNDVLVGIMERNRLLHKANTLLRREPRGMVPVGLWSKAFERLTRDNAGATAAYKILREKLVMWWLPNQVATTSDHSAVAATTAHSNTPREPRSVDDDTTADSATASSLEEPQRKRRRQS